MGNGVRIQIAKVLRGKQHTSLLSHSLWGEEEWEGREKWEGGGRNGRRGRSGRGEGRDNNNNRAESFSDPIINDQSNPLLLGHTIHECR